MYTYLTQCYPPAVALVLLRLSICHLSDCRYLTVCLSICHLTDCLSIYLCLSIPVQRFAPRLLVAPHRPREAVLHRPRGPHSPPLLRPGWQPSPGCTRPVTSITNTRARARARGVSSTTLDQGVTNQLERGYPGWCGDDGCQQRT